LVQLAQRIDGRQQTLDRASDLARRYDAYMQIELSVFTRAPSHQYYRNQSILIDNTGRVLATYEKTACSACQDAM